MTWAVLAGATAVLYAVHGAWSARISRRVGPMITGWTTFVFAFPILLAYLWIRGMPEVDSGFWVVWGVNTVLHLAGWYFFLAALRSGDLGIAFPLLALTPIFVVPVEWFLLGELPGLAGLAGIALIVSGVYLLNFQERHHGLLAPISALARDPAAVKMLGVAAFWSLSGTIDRVAVLESSPALYGVFLSGGLSLAFFPFVVMESRRRAEGRAEFRARISAAGSGGLILLGVLFSAMFIVQMEALDLALASYVLSIKRTGALLAVLIGYLAFRERSLGPRLVGTLVTLAGAALLVFLG